MTACQNWQWSICTYGRALSHQDAVTPVCNTPGRLPFCFLLPPPPLASSGRGETGGSCPCTVLCLPTSHPSPRLPNPLPPPAHPTCRKWLRAAAKSLASRLRSLNIFHSWARERRAARVGRHTWGQTQTHMHSTHVSTQDKLPLLLWARTVLGPMGPSRNTSAAVILWADMLCPVQCGTHRGQGGQ